MDDKLMVFTSVVTIKLSNGDGYYLEGDLYEFYNDHKEFAYYLLNAICDMIDEDFDTKEVFTIALEGRYEVPTVLISEEAIKAMERDKYHRDVLRALVKHYKFKKI